MINGADRVEFSDVKVIRADDLVITCQVGEKIVAIPPLRTLPGTEISRTGDQGRLVLPRDVAVSLGLA